MTRCAMQDVYELHQFSQAPAVYCQPLSDVSLINRCKMGRYCHEPVNRCIFEKLYEARLPTDPLKIRRVGMNVYMHYSPNIPSRLHGTDK